VDTSGTISTCGTGTAGFSGDVAPPSPPASALRAAWRGRYRQRFIADTGNHRIRQVTPDGLIHTIAARMRLASTETEGWRSPRASILPAACSSMRGDLYFADTGNNRVRRLVPQAAPPPEPLVVPPLSAVSAASLLAAPSSREIIVVFGAGLAPSREWPARLIRLACSRTC